MLEAAAARSAPRVLIAGVSARAAAESAARAGFAVTAVDAFGDLDQDPSVRSVTLSTGFSAHAAARAARAVECDAVAYLANFENHPRAVSVLAAGRALWGNAPAVLRRVRDPMLVHRALARRGCEVPAVQGAVPQELVEAGDPTAADETLPRLGVGPGWLVKPLASGGGHSVRPWRRGAPLPRGCYLQEFVEGTPGSVVFVAAGRRAALLGISRQLVGEPAFGTAGYRYCGNILAAAGDAQFARDEALAAAAWTLGRAVAEQFDLVGVNGIDFVARDGVPYAVEVNPRWCGSMELVERAYGLSVFGTHAAACTTGTLPAFDLLSARRATGAVGKAIVFARRDVTIGDTRGWLADASVRDVPNPGDRISRGRPVCTVFATGCDGVACHDALVQRATRVYAELAAWEE